jgi:hypothetical protein
MRTGKIISDVAHKLVDENDCKEIIDDFYASFSEEIVNLRLEAFE